MHIVEKEYRSVVGGSRLSPQRSEHQCGTDSMAGASPAQKGSCVWKPASFTSNELKAQEQRVKRQKYAVWALFLCVNAIFIKSYLISPDSYIHDTIVSLNAYFDIIQILSIVYHGIRRCVFPPARRPPPQTGPESMALLLTCYDETAREITSSLDSLVAQTGLDGHRRALIVVCDGRRKTGAGMRKTTAEVLRDEVFFDRSTREPETVRNAYVGWRRTMVDVDIFTGTYGGTLPFCCIIKHQNQSKRDSLLMVRSLLHKHNLRSRPSQPTSTETGIFSPDALHVLSTWLSKGAGIDVCDYVVGVDADTILHPSCIHHLVDEARQSGAAGVCGNLEVNFQGRVPTFWSLLTNAQFFAGQLINRRFQSLVTGRITCLTGCCQLLRVGGLNCGDQEVLAGPFGYYPGPSDNLWRQLIGKVGEDRHHTCIVHTTQPGARMTMAVQAVAYTNVPQSLGAFLNQRRRWTLSRLSNELLLVAGRDTHPFERVHAIVRLVHWVLFISIRMCGFLAFSPQFGFSPARRFRSLALLIIPRAFYLCMVVGRPIPALSRMYLAIGMVLSMLVGHFVFALSTLYTLYYMDYFGWRETLDGTGESISAKTPCFGEAAEPTNKDAKQS